MRFWLTLGLLFSTSPLVAQTHPCDLTTPTSFAVRRDQSVRVAFCHSQQEDDGAAIPIGQIRFRIVNASTQVVLTDLGLLAPTTGPNAAGLYYFESPPRFFAADIDVQVTADYNAVVVPSTPITVDVRGGPRPAVNPRIVGP